MFSLFRKKKRNISDWEFLLLQKIVEMLPLNYSFLKEQIHPDFFLDSTANVLLNDKWKRVICNQKLYKLYKNINLNYVIENILVYNQNQKIDIRVDIDIYEGVIIGYRIDSNSDSFEYSSINTDKIREKQFINKDEEELNKILGNITTSNRDLLDINSTFKIEINEGTFYVIKDFEDGNYLSINNNGSIFFMNHDPYKIEKLFETKESFFEAIKIGDFNIVDFYDKKMS